MAINNRGGGVGVKGERGVRVISGDRRRVSQRARNGAVRLSKVEFPVTEPERERNRGGERERERVGHVFEHVVRVYLVSLLSEDESPGDQLV